MQRDVNDLLTIRWEMSSSGEEEGMDPPSLSHFLHTQTISRLSDIISIKKKPKNLYIKILYIN